MLRFRAFDRLLRLLLPLRVKLCLQDPSGILCLRQLQSHLFTIPSCCILITSPVCLHICKLDGMLSSLPLSFFHLSVLQLLYLPSSLRAFSSPQLQLQEHLLVLRLQLRQAGRLGLFGLGQLGLSLLAQLLVDLQVPLAISVLYTLRRIAPGSLRTEKRVRGLQLFDSVSLLGYFSLQTSHVVFHLHGVHCNTCLFHALVLNLIF
mmetsp:Transcript_159942/g.298385  ORF Transcript_159942/g.298385 Transcript_159942/m.298385 type:complete len:205 (+) Transcript_159942:1763-2377(+)